MRSGPFIYSDFKKLFSINFFLTFSLMAQELLISYELYKLTSDPLTLGLIGLSVAIPYIGLSIFGGHLADHRSKKRIMTICILVLIFCNLYFILLYSNQNIESPLKVSLSYIGFAISGLARGIYQPAASSIRALLIPREFYSRGSSLNSTAWQLGSIFGSLIAGISYSSLGLIPSLICSLIICILSFILILLIKHKEKIIEDIKLNNTHLWKSIQEGIQFVLRSKILLYSISLDLVTVLFAGVIAILPVFAEDILNVGASGLGYLRAAPSIGTVIGLLAMNRFSPMKNAWKNMIIAVAGFGIATLIFALSNNIYLSLILLFLTGIFDSISIVIRGSLLQLIPPDHLRGRVVSVNNIFISSSNEIGAFESGFAAKVFGTIPSVVGGAVLTLIIILLVYVNSKELLGKDFE
ncbi:MAG: MFS transporter [Saprospiraceae bacterium]|nr:MFS transporter [Saprospiraceae bacterium]